MLLYYGYNLKLDYVGNVSFKRALKEQYINQLGFEKIYVVDMSVETKVTHSKQNLNDSRLDRPHCFRRPILLYILISEPLKTVLKLR